MPEEYEMPVTEGFFYDEESQMYLVYFDGELRGSAKDYVEATRIYLEVRR